VVALSRRFIRSPLEAHLHVLTLPAKEGAQGTITGHPPDVLEVAAHNFKGYSDARAGMPRWAPLCQCKRRAPGSRAGGRYGVDEKQRQRRASGGHRIAQDHAAPDSRVRTASIISPRVGASIRSLKAGNSRGTSRAGGELCCHGNSHRSQEILFYCRRGNVEYVFLQCG
jgi:hypothetical protein